MSDDADVSRIKSALDDPRALAEALDLLDGPRGKAWETQHGGGVMVLCPWHGERSPSCSITRGPDGGVRVKCFGCNATGDGLSLVAQRHGLDLRREFRAVLDLAAQYAGVAPPSRRERPSAPFEAVARPMVRRALPAPAEALDDGAVDAVAEALADLAPVTGDRAAMAYLRARGLDRSTALGWYSLPADDAARARLLAAVVERVGAARWASCGLAADGNAARWSWAWSGPRVVIPWCAPNGAVESLQGRLTVPERDGARKYVFPRGRRPRWPFGVEALDEAGEDTAVALVEGAVDAVSFNLLARRAGADAVALAVPGVSAWDARWLRLFARRPCIVALDADRAGAAAVAEARTRLAAVARRDERRRPMVTVRAPAGGVKDWNEALVARSTEAA